jgi:hypothetical protein
MLSDAVASILPPMAQVTVPMPPPWAADPAWPVIRPHDPAVAVRIIIIRRRVVEAPVEEVPAVEERPVRKTVKAVEAAEVTTAVEDVAAPETTTMDRDPSASESSAVEAASMKAASMKAAAVKAASAAVATTATMADLRCHSVGCKFRRGHARRTGQRQRLGTLL